MAMFVFLVFAAFVFLHFFKETPIGRTRTVAQLRGTMVNRTKYC